MRTVFGLAINFIIPILGAVAGIPFWEKSKDQDTTGFIRFFIFPGWIYLDLPTFSWIHLHPAESRLNQGSIS
jgi:hypothetical protein